ncbi:MAG: tetratricopeptide repeat protein, partial [Merismopedia sp. SIO2A8]|nr:tetratricopeptide repeat protein [Merismopedia sp. SIO2A8]
MKEMKYLNIKRWAMLSFYAIMGLLITLGWSGTLSVPLFSTLAPSAAIESSLAQPSSPPSIPSAQSLFNQGVAYFQAERFTDAIATWTQALNTSTPQLQPLIHSNLSLAYQHLGQWQRAETSLNQSLSFLNQQSPSSRSITDWDYYAKALNAQGWLFWRQGHPDAALDTWQQTQSAYESADYFLGVLGSQINQARALQSLGFSQAAAEILGDSQAAIAHQNNPSLQVMALQSLGNGLRRVGDLEQSEEVLKRALDMVATTFSSPEQQRAIQSSILLDLGNTERSLWEQAIAFNLVSNQQVHYKRNALEHYQRAGAITISPLSQAQAKANQLALLVDIQQYQPPQDATVSVDRTPEIWTLWRTLKSQFTNLPSGRLGIEVQLKSVNSLLKLNANSPSPLPKELWMDMADVLGQTIQQARQLQDIHTEALATGQLGQLYESTQQWSEAQALTEAAIALSESVQAPEIRYRWEWQLGRLHEKQGNIKGAIDAYSAAYKSLKSVRSNLLTIDSNIQFSFRDNIEPIHRHLVNLLLSEE